MRIKDLYYRIKYRPKKNQNGATAIIYSKKKKKKQKSDIEKQMDNIALTASPCYKDNQTVLNYIRTKHNLQSTIPTEAEKDVFKTNYILNHCPDILTTPEIKLFENGKAPKRSEFIEFQENQHKRFEEARLYPFEKLGLDISTYSFGVNIADGVALFKVVCENNKDELYITATTNFQPQEKDAELIRRISDEITVFRGIKQEDIDRRTRNFIIYAAALINLEKLKGANKNE